MQPYFMEQYLKCFTLDDGLIAKGTCCSESVTLWVDGGCNG